MPSAVAPNHRAANSDDADDLFNYDAGLEDALQSSNAPRNETNNATGESTANLDEEVKITRKRAPLARLDEER